MDSINRNQSEDNRQDFSGPAAVAKLRELVEKAKTCFFCTAAAISESEGARPMTVLQVDNAGALWFLSANDSHKNRELVVDPHVTLFFQGSTHSEFLRLAGRASISTDKAKIHELWSPLFSTWFTEGENDPRITVLQFAPTEGYYWDTKHGIAVAGVKMLIGAMLGKTVDDSIEGRLTF
jgi:general stress protein 26